MLVAYNPTTVGRWSLGYQLRDVIVVWYAKRT